MDSENWKNLFELWSKYEDIAMHFNQLLITLRTQALGGVAVGVSAIVGLLAYKEGRKDTKNGETDDSINWAAVACVFFALTAFWLALSILDLGYYAKLLQGSVEGILVAEQESTRFGPSGTISISNHINAAAADEISFRSFEKIRDTPVSDLAGEDSAVIAFYGIVLGTLAGFFGLALERWWEPFNTKPRRWTRLLSAAGGFILFSTVAVILFSVIVCKIR
jgi:hypothetical protein